MPLMLATLATSLLTLPADFRRYRGLPLSRFVYLAIYI